MIEQSRVQQIILRALFKEEELLPDFVSNLAEAKEAIKDNDYDFIFTSYSLPDGSGIELAQYVRKQEIERPGVVLLTTEDKRSILNEALSAGITRIIFRANTAELQLFIRELADSDFDTQPLTGNILYIEDDPVVSKVIIAMLSEHNFKCTSATSGEDGLALFSEHSFDLVIADFFLVGNLNGLDIVNSIRQMGGKKSRTPIMVLSAQSADDRKIEILRCGANDYIAKPILEEELLVRATNLITQKKLFDRVDSQREQLRELAMTDQLTTLYNRHFLVRFAPKRLAEALRHRYSLSLLVIDIDHFKEINDTYGHEAGDSVLKEIANTLKRGCRKEDIAIRLGGEEFLLLLPHCGEKDAIKKAEHLRQQMEMLNPDGIPVTASFGVTCLDGAEYTSKKKRVDFSTMFVAADTAVYQAKNQGRNRTAFVPISSK